MSHRAGVAFAVAGLLLHLAIAVFPFAATGLLAPAWAVVAVFIWWFVLLALAIRLARRERGRWRVVLVPVGALAGWFAFLSLGDVFLGWTA